MNMELFTEDVVFPRLEQDRKTKNLIIRYVDDEGILKNETYDMVVLSVGLQPCNKIVKLSEILRY